MTMFSAHTRAATLPVLVAERFSWGALLFGPLWLLLHRAWIAAAVALLGYVAIAAVPAPYGGPLSFGLAVLLGLLGQDVRRWSLARRGFALSDVVSGRDEDAALTRLLDARPHLLEGVRA